GKPCSLGTRGALKLDAEYRQTAPPKRGAVASALGFWRDLPTELLVPQDVHGLLTRGGERREGAGSDGEGRTQEKEATNGERVKAGTDLEEQLIDQERGQHGQQHTDQCSQEPDGAVFHHEERHDGSTLGANRLHDPDLATALQHRQRNSVSDDDGTGEERERGDDLGEQHELVDRLVE